MIPLSIVAAGVIAVAAAIFIFSSDKPRTADQRGITLQTLIVTAVLVLMAVAAGVVITAITRGQEDNLRNNATASSQANCEPWEIYDTNAAAGGRGGVSGSGGIQSSARGCVRVCYLRIINPGAGSANVVPEGTAMLVLYDDDVATAHATALNFNASLEFSRSDRQTANDNATTPKRFQVNGFRSVDINRAPDGAANNDITNISGFNINDEAITSAGALRSYEIRVAGDQRSCLLRNTNDNDEVFRSQGTL